MRPAMEKIIKLYEKKTGARIDVDYAESGTQMIKVKETGKGDLLVVHDPFLGAAKKQGLADTGWTVARLEGEIVVPKGNPMKIAKFSDLAKPGIRLILTDSTYSTLGHVVNVMANKSGCRDKLLANVITRTKSSGEAANAVAMGNADAAIVWNAVAFLRKNKLDAMPIEAGLQPVKNVDAITSATFGAIDMSNIHVVIMSLACSKQKAAARQFAEFTASPEAAAVWVSEGFSPGK